MGRNVGYVSTIWLCKTPMQREHALQNAENKDSTRIVTTVSFKMFYEEAVILVVTCIGEE